MGDFEVYIERSKTRFGDDVWIRSRLFDGGVAVYTWDGNGWVEEHVPPNSQLENRPAPSLYVPSGWMKILGAAFSEIDPPNTAVRDHLKDTMVVRDRLLTMVEKTHVD